MGYSENYKKEELQPEISLQRLAFEAVLKKSSRSYEDYNENHEPKKDKPIKPEISSLANLIEANKYAEPRKITKIIALKIFCETFSTKCSEGNTELKKYFNHKITISLSYQHLRQTIFEEMNKNGGVWDDTILFSEKFKESKAEFINYLREFSLEISWINFKIRLETKLGIYEALHPERRTTTKSVFKDKHPS